MAGEHRQGCVPQRRAPSTGRCRSRSVRRSVDVGRDFLDLGRAQARRERRHLPSAGRDLLRNSCCRGGELVEVGPDSACGVGGLERVAGAASRALEQRGTCGGVAARASRGTAARGRLDQDGPLHPGRGGVQRERREIRIRSLPRQVHGQRRCLAGRQRARCLADAGPRRRAPGLRAHPEPVVDLSGVRHLEHDRARGDRLGDDRDLVLRRLSQRHGDRRAGRRARGRAGSGREEQDNACGDRKKKTRSTPVNCRSTLEPETVHACPFHVAAIGRPPATNAIREQYSRNLEPAVCDPDPFQAEASPVLRRRSGSRAGRRSCPPLPDGRRRLRCVRPRKQRRHYELARNQSDRDEIPPGIGERAVPTMRLRRDGGHLDLAEVRQIGLVAVVADTIRRRLDDPFGGRRVLRAVGDLPHEGPAPCPVAETQLDLGRADDADGPGHRVAGCDLVGDLRERLVGEIRHELEPRVVDRTAGGIAVRIRSDLLLVVTVIATKPDPYGRGRWSLDTPTVRNRNSPRSGDTREVPRPGGRPRCGSNVPRPVGCHDGLHMFYRGDRGAVRLPRPDRRVAQHHRDRDGADERPHSTTASNRHPRDHSSLVADDSGAFPRHVAEVLVGGVSSSGFFTPCARIRIVRPDRSAHSFERSVVDRSGFRSAVEVETR